MLSHQTVNPAVTNVGNSIIDDDWFGVIQTGFNGWDGFQSQFEMLGGRSLRWPGGTLSEVQLNIYDISSESIFDGRYLFNYNPNRTRPNLTNMLEYAVENGLAFSMIIPTARYVGRASEAMSDVRDFLDRLLTGFYGPLPDNFTLEIGNEYYGLVEFRDNPESYGQVANLLINEIVNGFARHGISDINIAIQAGVTASDNEAIINELSGRALKVIDSVVAHSLPIGLRNLVRKETQGDAEDIGESRTERLKDYMDAWVEAVRTAGGPGNLDIFLSAWTVGSSAHTADGLDLSYHDFGLRAAGTMLELFAGYSSIGVDAAAAWGVDVTNLNSFSTIINGEVEILHQGVMFSWLSTNINGMRLAGDYIPRNPRTLLHSYTFTDPDSVTVFFVAGDISENGLDVVVDLVDLDEYIITSATSLRNSFPTGYVVRGDDTDQLQGLVHTENITFIRYADQLTFEINQDHEIVMMTFEMAIVPLSSSSITGTGGSDSLVGDGLDNEINGLAGNDSIGGMGGADSIFGGAGNDSISGNNGDDVLSGGPGNDILRGGPGNDYIHYDLGDDHLRGDDGDDIFQVRSSQVFEDFYAINSFFSSGEIYELRVSINGFSRSNAVIDGGNGFDMVILSDENDAYFLHDSYSGFHSSVSLSQDSFGLASAPRIISIEEISSGSGNDIVDLTSPDFQIGNIAIYGGDGNDTIWSSGGDDYLSGGDGDDQIFGGEGVDTLIGGLGADEFLFTSSDSGDTIQDFNIPEGDIIRVFSSGDDVSVIFDHSTHILSIALDSSPLEIFVFGNFEPSVFSNWSDFIYFEGSVAQIG